MKETFDLVCPTVPDAIKCIEEFSVAVNICLYPNEIKDKDKIVRIFKNTVNFLCKDNAEHVIEALTEETLVCLDDISTPIMIACVNPLVEKYKDLRSEKMKESYTITAEECEDIEKIENCLTNKFNNCLAPKLLQLTKEIFEISWAELSCQNLIV